MDEKQIILQDIYDKLKENGESVVEIGDIIARIYSSKKISEIAENFEKKLASIESSARADERKKVFERTKGAIGYDEKFGGYFYHRTGDHQ